ncbi:MAG: hypothetical protein ACTSX9_05255 [Candidatus Njordarchaeales archaeon]
MDKEFNDKIKQETVFLLESARNFLVALENAARSGRIDPFLQALQQLHKVIGEILGLTKLMQANLEEFRELFDRATKETQELLQKAFEIMEEFRRRLEERCKGSIK